MGARLQAIARFGSRHVPTVAPAVVAVVSLGVTIFALYILTFAIFGRDQGIFQYVAWALRNGDRAYLDVHEINGPLPHAWHMLLQRLGGEDEHVFRAIDTSVLAVVYALASATIPTWVGLESRRGAPVAWAAAGLAVLGAQYAVYDWWHTTQREGLYAMLVLASLALQAVAHDTREARRATALFFFSAVLSSLTWYGKPPCAVFAGLQVLVAIVDRASLAVSLRRAFAAGFAGALLVTLAMLGFVSAFGDVAAFVRMVSVVPLLHHTIWNLSLVDAYAAWGNAPRFHWALISVVAFVAVFVALKLPRRALLALVLPLGGFFVFALQGKGFPYHLHMLTLGTATAQVVVLAAVVRRAAERAAWVPVAALLAVALGVKSAEDAGFSAPERARWATLGRTPEDRGSRAYLEAFGWGDFFALDLREAAAFVRDKTRPDERVQTYGLDPYFLFLARRHSATPVIYDFELNVDAAIKGGSGATPSAHTRAALHDYRDAAEKLVLDDAKERPPAAFVFFDKAPFSFPEDSERDFAEHCPDVYRWLDGRYRPALRFGTVRVRLRNDIADRVAAATR